MIDSRTHAPKPMCAVPCYVSWVVYPTVLGLKPFGAGSKRNSYMRALTIYGGFNNISLTTYEQNTNYNKHTNRGRCTCCMRRVLNVVTPAHAQEYPYP